MQEVLEFTLGGVATGMIYAAVALSLVLIWRGTRVLNYSQGGMAMFTTYVAWTVISRTGSYWAGFAVALAAGLVLGALLERSVVRPVLGRPPLNAVIVTIGILIFLEGLAGVIYGGQPAAARHRLQPRRGQAAGRADRPGDDARLGSRRAVRGAGRRAGHAADVPVPEQHGLDLRARVYRGGDRRAGEPARRRHRGHRPRRRAQLRRRLPRQRARAAVRARRAHAGADGPARGTVRRLRGQARLRSPG